MVTRIGWAVVIAGFLLGASAEAQIWDGDGAAGGAVTWTTPANWSPNGVPANNGMANIFMAGMFDVVNTVDVNFDINSLTFNAGGGPFVINNSGGATLTIRGGGITNSNALLQTINAPLILFTGQTWTTTAGPLTIGGTVNLGTNQLIFTGGSTITISNVIQNTTGSIVKNSTGFLDLAANNLFTGGLTLNAGILTVSNNGAVGTGVLTLISGTIQAGTSAKTLSNAVTLGGNFSVGGPFDLNFSGAATLTGNRTITATSAGITTFSGAIGQDVAGRSFTKAGTGTMTFSGAAANTYTGDTTVNAGTLLLAKTAGVNAIAGGTVTVGDGAGGANSDILRLGALDQIGNGASVIVLSSGLFDLFGFSETINILNLQGGSVTTSSGTLTVNSSVNSVAFPTTSSVSGILNLAGGTRSFSIDDGMPSIDVDVAAVIANGGINKTGGGTLQFRGGPNTYTGATTVNAGTLVLAKQDNNISILGDLIVGGTSSGLVTVATPNQIANAANVTVNTGSELLISAAEDGFGLLTLNDGDVTIGAVASLTLLNDVVVNPTNATNSIDGLDRPLILSGARTFTVADAVPTTDLTITAVVQGGTLVKEGLGTMVLAGGVDNTAAVTINAGRLVTQKDADFIAAITGNVIIGDGVGGVDADVLRLEQSEQIAQAASDTVTVNSSGFLDLNIQSESIGNLVLNGGHVGAGFLVPLGDITVNSSAQTASIDSFIDLNGGTTNFAVAEGTAAIDLDITATVFINAGTINKAGAGTMRLVGTTSASTTVNVNEGTLELARPPDASIAGTLTIGDGIGGPLADLVRLAADDQLADSATAVSVQNSGLLDLNGFSDTVGALYLSAGTITTGAGTLSLANFVEAFANPQTAAITGNVHLGTAPRTFSVHDGAPAIDLQVSGTITAGAGGQLIKAGAGTLQLNSTSPLDFPVVLNAGALTGTLTIGPTGSLTQNAGTTLSGTLINRGTFTYNDGTFTGQLINEGTFTVGADFTFTAGNGIINFGNFTVGATLLVTANGTGLNNHGTITLAGGTIGGGGPLVNNGALTGRGTLAGSGGFANNGLLDISGGNLSLTNSGANTSAGLITVPSGLLLRLLGGNLTNTGIIDLDGGSISGTGTLVNAAGGIVEGGSSVQSPMTNNGGLIHANAGTTLLITNFSGGNINGGELRIENGSGINITNAFTSSGTIVLFGANANLIGGAITNSGMIRGSGRVTNPVLNSGSVLAEGGRLTLSGATPTNVAGGVIQVGPGSEMFYSQGLAINAGQIALLEGTFDNNNRPLANSGTIAGEGSIRTGGLTNTGTIGVGGGDLDVIGAVVNNGSVSTQSGSIVRFFGPVSGPGSYPGAGTVMFLSTFSPGASPAEVSFGGDLVFGGAASLTMELAGTTPGTQHDRLVVGGSASLAGSLTVMLLDGFMPSAGNAFEIISSAGGVIGTFNNEVLPALATNLEWDVHYGSNTVTLQVLSTVLPGDFNFDGSVDAADYVVWRKGLGTIFTPADFDVWRAHFGLTTGSGSGKLANFESGRPNTEHSGIVPEPSTLLLFSICGISLLAARSIRRSCP